jgi:hypothetical protein
LHACRPRTCPRVRAFNALTPQDARHDPDTPGNRVPALFHRLPGGGHPRRCLALCDEAGVSPVTLCRLPRTANAPSPRRGAGRTLKYLFRDYTGPHRDVRPAGSVIPVAVNPVRPSLPLQRHAGHCDDIPDAVGVREDKTSPRPPLSHVRAPVNGTLESARYGGRTTNHYAAPLETAPVRAQDASRCHDWNEIRQDDRQLHGTARHASTRRRIVRHACKSPSPWPIKGRAIPQPQGTTREDE